MKLSDYKEEIYKCSGCGICQNVCPVYKILKKESAVSRGKFKLLNTIINGDIKYSPKTLKYMGLCLHCQACSEFCPSEIDAQKIVETAQFDMLSVGIFNPFKLLIANILASRKCMSILKFFIDKIRKYRILEKIDLFHCKNNKLARKVLNVKIPDLHAEQKNYNDKTIKALYFKGCVNNYINPSCQNAVKKILDSTNIQLLEADFNCCGLPYKSIGDFKNFGKIALENLNIALNNDFDYLIFDCASCKNTFLSYTKFLHEENKEKMQNLTSKIKSIYELLDIINYTPIPKENPESVTIHYPCHTRKTADKELIAQTLEKIPNVTINTMKYADTCCGAAGTFIITNNKISKAISKNKAENIINTNSNTVITTCPSCIIGLNQGLIAANSNIEVLNLIEYLAK